MSSRKCYIVKHLLLVESVPFSNRDETFRSEGTFGVDVHGHSRTPSVLDRKLACDTKLMAFYKCHQKTGTSLWHEPLLTRMSPVQIPTIRDPIRCGRWLRQNPQKPVGMDPRAGSWKARHVDMGHAARAWGAHAWGALPAAPASEGAGDLYGVYTPAGASPSQPP